MLPGRQSSGGAGPAEALSRPQETPRTPRGPGASPPQRPLQARRSRHRASSLLCAHTHVCTHVDTRPTHTRPRPPARPRPRPRARTRAAGAGPERGCHGEAPARPGPSRAPAAPRRPHQVTRPGPGRAPPAAHVAGPAGGGGGSGREPGGAAGRTAGARARQVWKRQPSPALRLPGCPARLQPPGAARRCPRDPASHCCTGEGHIPAQVEVTAVCPS